jgi:phage replication O-like protein O
VPNALLETLMRCDLGPRALRVLLYLTRQTAGFHRDSVELSYVDIATATHVGQAKLPEVLRELTARGFVHRTSGNGKKNRFSLPAVSGAATLAGAAETAGADPVSAPAAETAGATSSQVGVATEPDFGSAFAPLHSDSHELKKLLSKEIFQRNSLSNTPEAWKRYTDTLTEKTRERANSIFEGLRQRFPEDDVDEIATCPENLRSFGAPDGKAWAEIKSPHGLMEVAWPQLRDFFAAKRATKLKTEKAATAHAQQLAARANAQNANDAALAERISLARAAFDEAFPTADERTAALEEFKPPWVSNAQVEPGRSLAIDAWFQRRVQPE